MGLKDLPNNIKSTNFMLKKVVSKVLILLTVSARTGFKFPTFFGYTILFVESLLILMAHQHPSELKTVFFIA